MDKSSLRSFRQSSTSVGIDVPIAEGILGLDGSDSQRTQSFATSIKAFCDQVGDVAQYRERFRQHSTTVSGDLATVAKHCMDTYAHVMIELNGNKPLLTISPQIGLRTFTASVYARSDITKPVVIKTISPEAGLVRCVYGSQEVGPNFEVMENAKFRLTCMKDPAAEIQFGIDTDRGQTQEIRIPAETGVLQRLVDQVSLLQTKLDQAASDILDAKARVPVGTIAWFNLQTCPGGWTPEELLRGRYAVGVNAAAVADVGLRVGVSLRNKENRAVGKHTHDYRRARRRRPVVEPASADVPRPRRLRRSACCM
jgi:hypothetical protein